MKKNNSKNDYKNLKIKREGTTTTSLPKNNSSQSLNSKNSISTVSSPRSNQLNTPQNQQGQQTQQQQNIKQGNSEFKRDLNFYIRQSSKPWAEIL
jgi:hypothetical protein